MTLFTNNSGKALLRPEQVAQLVVQPMIERAFATQVPPSSPSSPTVSASPSSRMTRRPSGPPRAPKSLSATRPSRNWTSSPASWPACPSSRTSWPQTPAPPRCRLSVTAWCATSHASSTKRSSAPSPHRRPPRVWPPSKVSPPSSSETAPSTPTYQSSTAPLRNQWTGPSSLTAMHG